MALETIVAPTRIREQRRHPRAQLRLPVRLRWLTPLGQLTEVAETLDAGRGGLLLFRPEPCCVGAMVWLTLPFHPGFPLTLPETPAQVVRVTTTSAGGRRVALEFEAPHDHGATTRGTRLGLARERRQHERFQLALPIRVRQPDSPWPEETMTGDISVEGLRFHTARLHSAGDLVRVALPPGDSVGRWTASADALGRVVRVEKGAGRLGEVWQQVALVRLPPETPDAVRR